MKKSTPERRATATQIAALFTTRRKRLGMTQIQLSQAMKVSQGYISKVEDGQVVPSVLEWLKFCTITRTKVDALVAPKRKRTAASRKKT